MYWFKLLVNAVCGHVYLWALFATVVDFSTVCAEESFRNFKVNKEYFRCKTEGCSNKIITVWSPYLLVVQYPSISIEALGVKVNCITSVDGIVLWFLIWLVNNVAILVVCQLSRDVISYEDS